jgi:ABC-2 type transport system permease protein
MKFVRDTLIVFRRQFRTNLRNPAWVVIGMVQPVLYLVLFGPLLDPMKAQIGATNAYAFFVPGILIMQAIFGAFFAGFSLVGEWREGVIEAERVTPASRTALLIGRMLREMVQLLIQALVLIGLGYALGMRAPLTGVLMGMLLTLLVGGAFACASNAFALTVKSEEIMAPVTQMVTMPVFLLSGLFLPMTLGPRWLDWLSKFIPTRHVVDGTRDVFAGFFLNAHLLWGTFWALAMFALAVWWGTSVFRRENA